MSQYIASTRPRVMRVTIVGLVGKQFNDTCELLASYPIKLDSIEPKGLLRRRCVCSDLIVLTRFAGHKHHAHARKIAPGHVLRVDHGAANAVADAIIASFGLKSDAA